MHSDERLGSELEFVLALEPGPGFVPESVLELVVPCMLVAVPVNWPELVVVI